MKYLTKDNLLYAAWAQSLIATVGSLYYQYGMNLQPCVLCWFQRICMYPLLFILTVAILRKEVKVHQYILPLSLTGLAWSIYHNLLYYNIIPESLAPCIQGISCTTKQLEWLGFITIPLQALVAFIIINLLMLIYARSKS